MNVTDAINKIEAAGATLRPDGDSVRIWYPDANVRCRLTGQVTSLRQHRTEVMDILKVRKINAPMPEGVRLIEWNLKEPPLLIERYAVVCDTTLFARSTIEQLRLAIAEPKRWAGWSVPQLIHRLAQVGVLVKLDKDEEERLLNFRQETIG